MSAPDYYRILHVQPDAPAPIIHASYRTLVERAFGGTLGSAEVALLDTAYAVLGNPQRRAAYDLERAAIPDRYAILEIKSPQTFPHWLTELFQRASLVPESISKYVHAVNALGLSRRVLATC